MSLTPTQAVGAAPAWRAWIEYAALKSQQPEISIEAARRVLVARGMKLPGNALWKVVKRGERAIDEGRAPVLEDFATHMTGSRHPTSGVADPISAALAREEFRAKLESIYIGSMGASSEYMTHGRRTGNMTLTLSRIAEEPECPEGLRAVLAAGKQPLPLRRFLRKRFSPEMEARLRGGRHSQLHGLVSRRSNHLQLPDGTRVEMGAGSIVEFDDMSLNHPYYISDGRGGWILTRQGLYARDVASKRWLGFDMIARPREAYRSEDILRFFRKLMMDYGRFDCLRLERGIWRAKKVRGWTITAEGELSAETVWDTPEVNTQEQERVELGLAEIGVRIQYTQDAHDKGLLEGGFREWQQVFGTYALAHVRIGAHRGEWEEAAKRLRQVRSGREPGELCFLSMAEAAAVNERVMRRLNAGGADARWDELVRMRPLPIVTRDQCRVFLTEVRETRIDGGRVQVSCGGEAQDFRGEFMVRLGHGYAVAVRWDPDEPTLGAAIYNRVRRENPANYEGWEVGAFLGWAEWEMPGPQLRVSAREAEGLPRVEMNPGEDIGDSIRRKQQRFVATEYRSMPRVGGKVVRRVEIRDGSRPECGGESKAESPTESVPEGMRSAAGSLVEDAGGGVRRVAGARSFRFDALVEA